MWTKSAKMVTAVQGGQDRRLKSLFLTKKDDSAPDGRFRYSEKLLTWEKTTQPQPEEANHQGWMGRLRRRSDNV